MWSTYEIALHFSTGKIKCHKCWYEKNCKTMHAKIMTSVFKYCLAIQNYFISPTKGHKCVEIYFL